MNHSRLPLLAPLILLLAVSTLGAREWTDSTGSYRVEADLVSVKSGKVYLEKTDSTVITVPLERLSKKDLRHLRELPEYEDYFKEHPIPGLEEPTSPTESAEPRSGEKEPPTGAASTTPAVKPEVTPASSATDGLPKSAIHVDDESFVGEVRRFDGLTWGVESLAFSPDGRFLAVGKPDRQLVVFNVDSSQQVANHSDLEELGSVSCLAFSPDGTRLLAGGDTGRIQIWDVAPNGLVTMAEHFAGHSNAIHTITVSADGKTVLSGGRGKKVRCWDLTDQRERFVLDGFGWDLLATYITRSGKQGLASDGLKVVLIDMKSGEAIQSMKFNNGAPQTCDIAPDGSRIVVNDGGKLEATEIKSGIGPVVLEGKGLAWKVKFHPGSRYILSGDANRIDLWDLQTGGRIHSFPCKYGYIQSIAVSPDRRHFVAASSRASSPAVVFRLPEEVYTPKKDDSESK